MQQQFALIRAKFQAVESVLQEVLSAQADPLYSLDQHEAWCGGAGGPEVVTCAEAEETRLLVPKAAWPIVKTTARHAPASTRASLASAPAAAG